MQHLEQLTMNVLNAAPAVEPPFQVTDPVNPATVLVAPLLVCILFGFPHCSYGVLMAFLWFSYAFPMFAL